MNEQDQQQQGSTKSIYLNLKMGCEKSLGGTAVALNCNNCQKNTNSKPINQHERSWSSLMRNCRSSPCLLIASVLIALLLGQMLALFNIDNLLSSIKDILYRRGDKKPAEAAMKLEAINEVQRISRLVTSVLIAIKLSHEFHYKSLVLGGILMTVLSTLLIKVANSCELLLVAVSIGAASTACISVGALSLIAGGLSMNGLSRNIVLVAVACIAYTPLSLWIYQLVEPLLMLVLTDWIRLLIFACVAIATGLILPPPRRVNVDAQRHKGSPVMTLIKDRYILITLGATFFLSTITNMSAIFPKHMGPGLVPTILQYSIYIGAAIGFGWAKTTGHRWGYIMTGYVLAGCSLLLLFLTCSRSFSVSIIVANIIVVLSTMLMLGQLADARHNSFYGRAYALGDVAFCAGTIGSNFYVNLQDFNHVIIIYMGSFLCFLFAVSLYKLKNAPEKRAVNIDGAERITSVA